MAVRVDSPADGIVRILIDRADKRNAVDAATRAALAAAVTDARADPACGAILLGGTGGLFSAGGDLPSMVGQTEDEARERMREGHRLCRLVAEAPMPVVTAAEDVCAGAAVGLALLGDRIVAGSGTRFLFPFLSLGLVPDWGVLRSLPARVGGACARRLILDGKSISGVVAERIGLIDDYVGDGDVMAAAVERATALAALSPRAFARMKARLAAPSPTLDHDLAREEEDQVALFLGPDVAEGYRAFVEKRRPQFAMGGAA